MVRFYVTIMKQFKLSLSLQLLSAFFSLLGIVFSLFVQNTFDDGWRSLLFFTLQSNLWMAVILIIFAIAEILKHKTGTSFINQTRYQVKYVLRTSVMLTLLVFGFLLLPFVPPSYTISITSSSLHFIAPLLALADFLIHDGRLTLKKRYLLDASSPALRRSICNGLCDCRHHLPAR